MSRKEVKKRIREEMGADQARYDEVTRRLQERIERGLREMEHRPPEVRRDQAGYDEVTRQLQERIERGLREMDQRGERRESS